MLIVVLIVVVGVVRMAIVAGIDSTVSSGTAPTFTYPGGATTSSESSPGNATAPAKTGDNPLLTDPNATLLPASCDYSPWSTQVQAARSFFESAAGCLASAWEPVLRAAGLPFERPQLNVTADTSGISTPCTGTTTNFAAFYCSANKTIYMPISQLQTEMFGDDWVVYLSVFAHEYGHHVQAVAGILGKANRDRVAAGVRSTSGLELSRRVELQANCFDGMYLGSSEDGGSLTSSQLNDATEDSHNRGDSGGDMRDHGSAAHGGQWFEAGAEHNRTQQCNTFTASSGEVS
ncbi:neutral zinc metallopeptidase [Nocardia callitridis]|uniref:Neutral zinc metallopeptidase n=1 Tax=Nocardia callitridis TaxID=648753 RepID=A0ABP9JYE2_9NOCA